MPRPRWLWPVAITASNRAIRLTVTATTETVLITTGSYHATGALVDGDDLLREVRDALNTHSLAAGGFVVTMATATGRVTVAHPTLGWTILSANALTTFDVGMLGFDNTANVVGVAGVNTVSPWQAGNQWRPQRLAVEHTTEADYPGGTQTWTVGDVVQDVIHTTTPRIWREVRVPFVLPFFVTRDRADSSAFTPSGMTVSDPNAPLLWPAVHQFKGADTTMTDYWSLLEAAARGVALRYYPDETVQSYTSGVRLLWPDPSRKALSDLAVLLDGRAGQFDVTIRQAE